MRITAFLGHNNSWVKTIMLYFFVVSVLSYLIGGISNAVIISKRIYKKDIRDFGSKNAGATNMLRVFGKKAGVSVLLLDMLKGFAAVTLARCVVAFFQAPYECLLFAGFFAQVGHMFPAFFGFRGGKGVATAAGSALGIMPLTALLLLVLFVALIAATKTVSLASGICAAVYPLFAFFLGNDKREYNFIFAAACAVMIGIKHIPNIIRLLDGEEKRLF